jgi:hypothetical protein
MIGCHQAPAQASLELTPAALGDGSKLVGAPARGMLCAGATPRPLIIDPQHPEQSLLYEKLQPSPACGATMPYLSPPLSSGDAQCILDWIKRVPGVATK